MEKCQKSEAWSVNWDGKWDIWGSESHSEVAALSLALRPCEISLTTMICYLPPLPLLDCPQQRHCMKRHTLGGRWQLVFSPLCIKQGASLGCTLLCILVMEPFLVLFPAKKMELVQLTAFTVSPFCHETPRATFS